MAPLNPALDQPQVLDNDGSPSAFSCRLANHEITFETNNTADLHNLFWPWANTQYARSICLTLSAPREDVFMPMVTHLYPGYIDAIYGTEGVIVSKKLFAPFDSTYERAAVWLLECQAEGDRILRIDVEIDWGEPLEQRMVDGLLVAQHAPQAAQGIFKQQNAESTRVFGNPDGRPDQVDIEDPQRAKLVYHVLVNGEVEVPLMLTVSDVGEQMAWNGFLALREGSQPFKKSVSAWDKLLSRSQLWTPDVRLNQAVQAGKVEAIRGVQRLRPGLASSGRNVVDVPRLVDALDTIDIAQSRNLLAFLRRLAEKTDGRLPEQFPVRRKDEPVDPGALLTQTNSAYLQSLFSHLQHHFDAKLLAQHYTAVGLCAEMLLRSAESTLAGFASDGAVSSAKPLEHGLYCAAGLAHLYGDGANVDRWGTATTCAPEPSCTLPATGDALALVANAIWHGCGIRCGTNNLDAPWSVVPTWPSEWAWWALLDLPLDPVDTDKTLSLLWDGAVLHSTVPVQTVADGTRADDIQVDRVQLEVHDQICARHIGELDFDLAFELIDGKGDDAVQTVFKPRFGL